MKKKILLFSDGALFGGSEYVVVNIMKDKILSERFDLYFAYREHPVYKKQIDILFSNDEKKKLIPLKLLSNKSLYPKINEIFNLRVAWILKFILRIIEHTRIYDIINYFLIRKMLKKIQPDLVHGNNGGYPAADTCLLFIIASHKLGIKNVLQINNIPNCSKKYWDKEIKKSADAFIIASKYTSNMINRIRNITRENIYTLRDNVKNVCPTTDASILREQLGIKNDAIVLIQVALLLRYKGQINLLESLDLMHRINPEFFQKIFLILIGSGEMEHELKEYINNHNLNDRVLLLGYRNDYIDFVNMADLMIHPSRANEDMPLIILSAMSLGKPVISCNFAGIPEEIEDNKTGILLDPNSNTFVQDLCDAIPYTYERRLEMGCNARYKFLSEFSTEAYEEGLSSIYNTLTMDKN